jgi:hypothetical protein
MDVGDDDSVYQCVHGNCVRLAMRDPTPDAVEDEDKLTRYNFGSAHASSFNAAYCDGSIHTVSYEINFATHAAMASRTAGDKVDRTNRPAYTGANRRPFRPRGAANGRTVVGTGLHDGRIEALMATIPEPSSIILASMAAAASLAFALRKRRHFPKS